MRLRRYSTLSYTRTLKARDLEESDESRVRPRVPSFLLPLYYFRERREANMELSFLRFIAHRDSEVLHKISPQIWSLLPFVTFLFGCFEAIRIQGHLALAQMPFAAFIAFALIGALDALSGFSAALGLFLSQLLFGDISSVRAFVLFVAITALWFAPSLVASMYYLTLRIEIWRVLKRASFGVRITLTLIASALFAGITTIFLTLLAQSMSIDHQISSLWRWPLAAILSAAVLVKNLADFTFDARAIQGRVKRTVKEESLFVARLLSPGSYTVITVVLFSVIYVWTQMIVTSLVVALLLSIPFGLLFLSFPELSRLRVPSKRRSILIESVVLGALTYGIFIALLRLPMNVVEKSRAFILLAVIPVVIHSLFAVLSDSRDRAKESVDEEH
jgi:hypothetical protein